VRDQAKEYVLERMKELHPWVVDRFATGGGYYSKNYYTFVEVEETTKDGSQCGTVGIEQTLGEPSQWACLED
jgi:hypothetical protein